jgi:H+-transporting ATPase
MEQKIAVLRDGAAQNLLTRLLVPGDIILLCGGAAVPADVDWVEGDILSVDTAALTGEPLPRKYPSEDHGKSILSGCTIVAGEAYCIVVKTGINTEMGSSQAEIMKDKSVKKISVFEDNVLYAVKLIILCSVIDVLIIFLVQGLGRGEFKNNVRELIASCLSIIIASVPVALPLVLQVTMALGAGKMARRFNAVVTNLPALQDISSMTILCSDKTGTLTTANLSIIKDAIWCNEEFRKDDVAFYAALASNRDKKEDPIDRCVFQFFDKTASNPAKDAIDEYTLKRTVGFNPIYKRVLWEYTHPQLGSILVAKGLPNKIVDTADGGEDDADDQWKVDNYQELKKTVATLDAKLSKTGYKTLGVAVKIGQNGNFKFVGILPMLDPPRHDTKATIRNLKDAGVKVKMITGDHLNIAKETARLIGLGINMYKGEEIRDNSETTRETILQSDGFAQVLPRDKREVVLVLKNVFHNVVGMTGDGVNDAPALSAAQCGIAVDDATDAAKNAAAIILTSPGLSAIYMGIVESRRIFRKLKSYIIYRFAATIQIVVVLTLLIFISNCPINSFYIVLLALLNDVTLLPIAYDRQNPSATPEFPTVFPILVTAISLGALETALTMLWAYAADSTGFFKSDFDIFRCSQSAQSGVWVQMFIAAEIFVFTARTPTFFFLSILPSPKLFISIFLGCLLVSILACAADGFGHLWVQDVAIIWLYDIICLFVVDAAKVLVLHLLDESFEVLDIAEVEDVGHEEDRVQLPSGQLPLPVHPKAGDLEGQQPLIAGKEGEPVSPPPAVDADVIRANRATSSIIKLDRWRSNTVIGGSNDGRPSSSRPISPNSFDGHRGLSSSNIALPRTASNAALIAINRSTSNANVSPGRTRTISGAHIVSASNAHKGSHIDISSRSISSTNLRPYTPSNRYLHR